MQDIKILTNLVERLGLDQKSELSEADRQDLIASLESAGFNELANYVDSLANAKELHDLIVNTLYG